VTATSTIMPDADEVRDEHGAEVLARRHVVDVEVAQELVRRGWRQRGHGEGLAFCVTCDQPTVWMDHQGRPMHHHCTRRHGQTRRPPFRLPTPGADRFMRGFEQRAPRPLPPPTTTMDQVERTDDVDATLWAVLCGAPPPSAESPVPPPPPQPTTAVEKPKRARRKKAGPEAAPDATVQSPASPASVEGGAAPADAAAAEPKKPRKPRKKKPTEVSLPPAGETPAAQAAEPEMSAPEPGPAPVPEAAPATTTEPSHTSMAELGLDW